MSTKTNTYSTSHPEILRQIDEADSLLQILCHRKQAVHNADVGDGDGHEGASALKQHEFTIKPKSDAEVIEELQIVNLNLRSLVDKLLNDLNESQQENARLRKRISEYEPELKFEAAHNTGKFPHISSSSTMAMSPPPQGSLYLTLTAEQESQKNEEDSITATTMVPDYDDIPEFDPLDDPEFDMGEFQSHQSQSAK